MPSALNDLPINAQFLFSPNSSDKVKRACSDAGFTGIFHFYTSAQSGDQADSTELGVATISFHAPLNPNVNPNINYKNVSVFRANGKANIWHTNPTPDSPFIDFDHSILWVPLQNGICEGIFVKTAN